MRFPKLHPSRLDLTITLQDVWQNEPVCGITCYGATKASASCDYSCYRYQTCLFMQQSLANTLSRRSAQQAALIEAKVLFFSHSWVFRLTFFAAATKWGSHNRI
mmetsp:Transcript_18773/g.51744  ORF Transcript_18773/g.51744 Transcript_18773/m.51744 type:complete len:104 (-) Transcript_18773:217-528(-)